MVWLSNGETIGYMGVGYVHSTVWGIQKVKPSRYGNDHGKDSPSWHLRHKRNWHIQMHFTHKTASLHVQSVSITWRPCITHEEKNIHSTLATSREQSWPTHDPEPTTRAVTFCSGTCHQISARSTPLANDPPRKVKQNCKCLSSWRKKCCTIHSQGISSASAWIKSLKVGPCPSAPLPKRTCQNAPAPLLIFSAAQRLQIILPPNF